MSHVIAERNGTRLTLRARELRGTRTLSDAAALIGIRHDELSRIERGDTTSMRFDTLLRLCDAYQVTPGELLHIEKDPATMSPLDHVLAAITAGTATTHRPPRNRARLTDDETVDDATDDEVAAGIADITDRDIPIRRTRRRAPDTIGPH
jgi:DNA-binding Xre family transcriptional regulator